MPRLLRAIFFALNYRRHYSYRDKPKGIQSLLVRLDTVKGNAVFHYRNLILNSMSEITSSGAISAETMVEDILLSDNLPSMRQHLREMADSYLLTEDEADYRQSVYSTYMNLDKFLSKAEALINQNERRAV